MTVSLVKRSLLRSADLLQIDGIEFFDLVDTVRIPAQPDDLTHAVGPDDRIDSLAQQYYGDPVLWWVIAMANDLEILPTDLLTGRVLRIPSPTYVLQQLVR